MSYRIKIKKAIIAKLSDLISKKQHYILTKFIDHGICDSLIQNLENDNPLLLRIFEIIETFLNYDNNMENVLIFHLIFVRQKIELLEENIPLETF